MATVVTDPNARMARIYAGMGARAPRAPSVSIPASHAGGASVPRGGGGGTTGSARNNPLAGALSGDLTPDQIQQLGPEPSSTGVRLFDALGGLGSQHANWEQQARMMIAKNQGDIIGKLNQHLDALQQAFAQTGSPAQAFARVLSSPDGIHALAVLDLGCRNLTLYRMVI